MKLPRFRVLLLLLACTWFCEASPANDLEQNAPRISASVYNGPAMDTLRELTDSFGGRLSGSPAYEKAAEWAEAKFRSYGIQNVTLEPFTIPNGWQRGSASGRMLAPLDRPLHVESLGWAPSTPTGGVKSEVVLLGDLSPDSIKSRQDLTGRIVMLNRSQIFAEGNRKATPMLRAAYPLLKEAGVAAVLYPDRENNNLLNAHSADWRARLSPLPIIELGMEDSVLIQRLLQKGPVTVQLDAQNKTEGPIQVHNVIAEIPGSDSNGEWIIIGAHLDSWDAGTGAQDNGTGTASVLEVARVLSAMGQPRRTIRFALWGGEEEGILGSYAYTQAHLSELNKCVAVLNTDNGAGHPKGWKTEGREDVKAAMQPLSDSLLKGMSGGGLSLETTYDTDHGPFMLQGIPALDFWVDMSHYMEIHHKSSDTFDKVDALDFKGGIAIVAVTAWTLAEEPNPIAPHIDHAAVGEIVRKAGLEDMLKESGQWKP
jgi:hypothetical protein